MSAGQQYAAPARQYFLDVHTYLQMVLRRTALHGKNPRFAILTKRGPVRIIKTEGRLYMTVSPYTS